MKYALLIYETDAAIAKRENPETAPAYWAGWEAYGKAIGDAGVMRGGAGLQAVAMSTTLRLRGGERLVQDGPFADTKERLGGFYLIEVEDLDAALAWAARCPAAETGAIEIRPLLAMG